MALATSSRSPNSWLISLRYWVSPQPAQAPENSNSGWRTWEPLIVSGPSARGRARGSPGSGPSARARAPGTVDRGHVDRLVLDLLLGVGRADLDADPAAGAVVGRDLDGQLHPGQVAGAEVLGLEVVGGASRASGRTPSCGWSSAGRRWRTCRSRCRSTGPRWGSRRPAALLPPGRAGREGAVDGQGADRQQVAVAFQHPGGDPLDEVGRLLGDGRAAVAGGGGRRRHLDLAEPVQGPVHGGEVAGHHLLAAAAERLLDPGLDGRDGLVPGSTPTGRRSRAASRC